MPFSRNPRPEVLPSIVDASPTPFWLDDAQRPQPAPPLAGDIRADLLVVGAGFTGLWAALLAREADPAREVVLVEAGTTATGATGRNGGFVAASLTHGFENGFERWPDEMAALGAMGRVNLDAIAETVRKYQIECDFLRSGELTVATEPYQVTSMRHAPAITAPYYESYTWLEREQIQQQVKSPTYLGALFNPDVAMANPARLAWGLRRACLESGVRLYENTPVSALQNEGRSVLARTPQGSIRAAQVALATNAFPPVLKRLNHYIVPVYDYVLVSQPLSAEQRASIGWEQRQGMADAGNQFHYYRTTQDGRILWGGYDAVYYPNNGFGPQLETNRESFARLADHFFATFPQLEGLRFTHAWGGAIDTCSRFSVFWGSAHGGKTAYAVGYTGLGVGASRFGALVLLDKLAGRQNERTRLRMVREKPLPFPPEPLRGAVINFTRRSLDRADRSDGQRDLWLRTLDAFGLGFDS